VIAGRPVLAVALALVCAAASPADLAAGEVTDMLGRRVRLPERPGRVVSLAPSVTEIAYALGADDRLVGVTDDCNYPPETARKPRTGGFYNPNFEVIVTLRPDLILATSIEGAREETFRGIESFGVPVYVVRPVDVRSVQESIERIGGLLGRGEEATRMVRAMRAEEAAVRHAVAGRRAPRVMYVVWGSPLIVPGRDTLITDLIRRAGGDSISGREAAAYPRLSAEEAVARRPEVVVLGQHGQSTIDQRLAAWAHLTLLPAVRQGRIHQIDGDLMHRPGPRIIEALRLLAAMFHPEAFPDARR
jgi:iron complex transport system substrate-binding protein